MFRSEHRRLRLPLCAALLAALGFSSCSGSSSGDQIAGGAFVVLKTEPANNGRIFLNQSIKVFFSNPVDLATANFNSLSFLVRDASGKPITESVFGTFRNGVDENGDPDERILEFIPRLPTNDSYTDGGFRPGRTYVMSIVGSASGTSGTLRDQAGRTLSPNSPIQSMQFATASGTTAKQLFVDRQVGGPRVLNIDVNPKFGGKVGLNELGGEPVEVRILFNQTIDPASTNVPIRQNLDPINGQIRDKGRVFLEYDDPDLGTRRWIRGSVEVPVNDLQRAIVTIRPDGVLPNNALVKVIVEAEFQDVSGESNVNDSAYKREVGTFRTDDRFAAQFDMVAFDFENSDLQDPRASFRDPVADIANGELSASFDFEGITTPFNFRPTVPNVELDTNFARVTPSNGSEITVIGGVFRFNNVTIPRGTTVRGKGTNPMVWLATGDFRVDGELRVDGRDGADVTTLNGANFPTAGGAGACGGGDGGAGSPETTQTSQRGANGFGPNQVEDGGGQGGEVACGAIAASHFGSGGGGGSHATKGDTNFVSVWGADPLASGIGGVGKNPVGGNDVDVPGGLVGDTIFDDDITENNFWGRLLDKDDKVVFGELKGPVGGSGGGGGGDRTKAANCIETNFFNDEKGGGGGGGAGVLLVKALGKITVGAKGIISANGGFGGGGEDQGSTRFGGGGGGGSGGMIILSSATGIDIYQHGGRWAQRDIEFAVTADGGVGVNRAPSARTTKYASPGRPNAGGFGGMGIVQLMAPAGDDSDGTGNPQDDNIRYLDGAGNEIKAKLNMLVQGEIRPDPVIMPVTYGRNSTYESRFVSTGATVRRVVSTSVGQVRATTTKPAFEPNAKTYGPDWFFSGINATGANAGYLATDSQSGAIVQDVRVFGGVKKLPVLSTQANALSVRALQAHRVRLDTARLPDDGSLENHVARFYDASNSRLGDFRVLGHTAREIYLDAREGSMPNGVSSVEIVEKFYEVVTDGVEGLGQVFEQGSNRFPVANVRIGFAFHKDPSRPDLDTSGSKPVDKNRFPQALDGYVYDLMGSASSSVREQLRKLHYPFMKVKVRFNLNYNPTDPETAGPNPVSPTTNRPAIRFIRVPYIF